MPIGEKTVHIVSMGEALARIEAHGHTALTVELEGVSLGRMHSKLCILQLTCKANPYTIYLVDVTVLSDAAFSMLSASSSGMTLKSLIKDTVDVGLPQ
jgi:hypothetical protein